jgi:hypothetical protein
MSFTLSESVRISDLLEPYYHAHVIFHLITLTIIYTPSQL